MSTPVLKPISARSALLSVLLGADESSLTAREMVAAGSLLGIAETTVRAALSRMASSGDLVREANGYALSARLRRRQARQEEAVRPRTHETGGRWDMFVITQSGRHAHERAELRTSLTELRLAEVREGVWTRPANLDLTWPDAVAGTGEHFVSTPAGDPGQLAARLWDLTGWAQRARQLLAAADTDDHVQRFTACASSVRHLLADPVLPADLLPADWPGDELRASHLRYRRWLIDLRRELSTESA
ncbi:PaaX family transcriptional regulator [Nocardioides albertanoniae]|uniref:PaaX family transcriptional regulator n=1 Tax=Nocardioides albertanoniae TaxID=1175486 RepID=A0A543A251_9ACTN|nr:PaaX family transcriptional regulator C-terminal domain-containing protein [Nocardioides albertanoniae]TQL66654.1 PaaX family transcriptional regulator [Nocardioides albertanoniae]